MFGYNYKYEMNASKNIIKLAPTKGTYAKAMLPSLLLWVGLGALIASASKQPTVLEYNDTIDYENNPND